MVECSNDIISIRYIIVSTGQFTQGTLNIILGIFDFTVGVGTTQPIGITTYIKSPILWVIKVVYHKARNKH